MKFEDLIDFIRSRMGMSQIYQPLLIRSLVEAGGTPNPRGGARGVVPDKMNY